MKHQYKAVIVILISWAAITSCNMQNEKKETTSDSATTSPQAGGSQQKVSRQEAYNELLVRARNREIKENKDKNALKDTFPTNARLKMMLDKELYYVIYGEDDRQNVYEVTDPLILEDAKKAGCVITKDQLQKNANGTFSLKPGGVYKLLYNLCGNEKFLDETVASFCSGFAIDEKRFVTAGHCIKGNKIDNLAIVYGYEVRTPNTVNLIIRPEDIFEPESIVARDSNRTAKEDFCILRIKGSFQKYRIADIRTQGKIGDNEQVHVIGYPCGLPMKITPNGRVYNNSIENYFITNLDTYGGNSGSPVFNSKTHVVEGILVRGNSDFRRIEIDKCYRSFLCPPDIGGCDGEDASRVSQFWKWLKK